MTAERARRGREAEAAARRLFEKQRFEIVAANYRAPCGEIDLIARKGRLLVFVEVRRRRDAGHGTAVESIDRAKRRKLVRTAQHYLAAHPHHGPARFDVVAFDGDPARTRAVWIRNAFDEEAA